MTPHFKVARTDQRSYSEWFLSRVAAAETESELRDLLNYAETGELAAAIVLRGQEITAERDADPEIEGSRAWLEDNGQFGVEHDHAPRQNLRREVLRTRRIFLGR